MEYRQGWEWAWGAVGACDSAGEQSEMKEVTPKAKWRPEGLGGSKRRARRMLFQVGTACANIWR